jgi:hypothetical protein
MWIAGIAVTAFSAVGIAAIMGWISTVEFMRFVSGNREIAG